MRISSAFLTAILLAWALLPASVEGQSMGMSRGGWQGSAPAAYCVSHGGYPKDSYCYFPDGTYCDLWAFYNGTCPGEEYYEQMMWEAEAYRFLYSDYPYYSGYTPSNPPYAYYPYGYYPYGYYPYGNYYGGQPGYWPYRQDPLSPMSPAPAYGGSLAK
jgi:hypothetical protein